MSKHILREFAQDQECTANIQGYCNYDPSTTILAHYRPGFFGLAMKPDDILGAHVCSICHDILDGRRKTDISQEDLDATFHSAIIKTLQRITNRYDINFTRKKK